MNSFDVRPLFVALLLVSGFAVAGSGTNPSIRVRPEHVRAFAPETERSVVVREGRGLYRRVSTQAACPALLDANRLAFQVGTLLTGVDSAGRTIATTDRSAVPSQISGETPHAALVAIGADSRVACAISSVAEVDATTFDAAASLHGSRDNRYGG